MAKDKAPESAQRLQKQIAQGKNPQPTKAPGKGVSSGSK